ncbi:Uncharacterised protein [BD1-7 clade bacterium]|uniref:IraD/Gp25-like domain-containing protein n=1 Tax=BD1-7 clade bacterium TaxID=2029982 RepID=A0A5S9N5N3_9GAMM|nr:Uncharacterised protein [BD1-7 clade bacterium]
MSILIKLKGEWDGGIDCKRDSVIENVISLMSSRSPVWQDRNDLTDRIDASVARYGMKRVLSAPGKANIETFLEEIRQLIITFEPRYRHVSVVQDEKQQHSNVLHFRIEGMIGSDDGEETMVLESSLDLTTSHLNIRKTNLDFF